VEELKKKFGNDKSRLQQETMKLYREHGINPATQMLTCLPMFLQLPIWIALFLSLSNNIQLRHQPFVLFPWVNDLTAPDALFTFPSPIVIPLLGWEIPTFNLLPILVALFIYLQQKLQPKPKPNPNASEQQRAQQEMMQKMMPLMSIMMLVFFYKMPSGLNLYIMFSSLFGAIEQHRIRKHVKEKETPGSATGPAPKPKPPTPKGPARMTVFEKLHARFERLRKAAEEAQKAQPRRPDKGDKPKR
jgi:YidC/Oxa1 family membrane protein insertase